jgi:hypothetical protein
MKCPQSQAFCFLFNLASVASCDQEKVSYHLLHLLLDAMRLISLKDTMYAIWNIKLEMYLLLMRIVGVNSNSVPPIQQNRQWQD